MNQRALLNRLPFLLLSIFFLAWALTGYLMPVSSLRWTTVVAGLGCLLIARTHATPWQAFGRWTALAMIGQACTLQLLRVGGANRLQVFDEWSRMATGYRLLCLVFVILQAGAALWGFKPFWKTALPRIRSLLTPSAALVLLALFVLAIVPVAPATAQAFFKGDLLFRLGAQASKVALGLFVAAVGALNLTLAVAAIPGDSWERITARWRRVNSRVLMRACAAWTVVMCSLLAWFVMDGLPHIPDDVAYLFQAKYFAAGKLYLPLPPEPQAFACGLVLFDGDKWYSAQLPGWPAVLAIGAWFGAPWLVNPFLAGAAILLTFAFVRRLYDEQVAAASVVLLSLSPWLLYMSTSFMGHPVSLVFTLGSLVAVQRARETGGMVAGLLAGLCLGGLGVTRPLEALAVALPIGFWWLATGWKKLRVASVASAVLGGVAAVGLMLAYNRALTGDPLRLPFEKVTDLSLYSGANRLGFGPNVGNFGWEHLDPLPGHGPVDVAVNTNHNLYLVNFELFGWAVGSLLFAFLLVTWRRVRNDLLMWGLIFAVWAAMSTYWFSGGPDFGARYWYQMIVPFTVLTVRGAQEFAARWDAGNFSSHSGQRVWAFAALAGAIAFLNLIPWRAIDKYKNYRGVSGEVRQIARERDFGRSLVFLRGDVLRRPWASTTYAAGFALNPPTLDPNAPGPIYARDLGEESRERLRRYFADRPVWIVADPELTRKGFVLLEGPLPPWNANSAAPKP